MENTDGLFTHHEETFFRWSDSNKVSSKKTYLLKKRREKRLCFQAQSLLAMLRDAEKRLQTHHRMLEEAEDELVREIMMKFAEQSKAEVNIIKAIFDYQQDGDVELVA